DRFLRLRAPAVFTAHDLLPRRTAAKRELWRRILARFDAVVVHSDYGRAALGELGVRARVIPHAVFPSDPPPADDGRTLLALEAACAGARRARAELTWDEAARAHLELYRELT